MSDTHDPADRGDVADALVADILASFSLITERFESNEHEQWQWIIQHSSNPLVAEMFQDMSTMTARVINAIGQLEPVNGITISEQFRIPKGTVSKITRRLLVKNLIRAESRPNNKKEILFRLTSLGKELFSVHRDFDELMGRGFTRFLRRYSIDELQLIVHILHDATEASFITLGQEALSTPERGEKK